VANGEDTLMESMKTSPLHRTLNGSMGKAEMPQLPNRDDAVLTIG
jgi:hypothetical protein